MVLLLIVTDKKSLVPEGKGLPEHVPRLDDAPKVASYDPPGAVREQAGGKQSLVLVPASNVQVYPSLLRHSLSVVHSLRQTPEAAPGT